MTDQLQPQHPQRPPRREETTTEREARRAVEARDVLREKLGSTPGESVTVPTGQGTRVIIERTVTYRIERELPIPRLDTDTWSNLLHAVGRVTIANEIWPSNPPMPGELDAFNYVTVVSRVFEEVKPPDGS